MLSFTLFLVHMLFLSVLFSIVSYLLGEERAGLYASRVILFVYHVCVTFCLFALPFGVISSVVAAASDSGTPWTFRLSFFKFSQMKKAWVAI